MAALKVAKKDLRKRMRQKLSALPIESVQTQSSKVVARLLTLPQYQAARRISVYLSMPGGEIQTKDIVHDAFKQGKTVFVPYTHKTSVEGPSSVMDMVRLRSLEDFNSLEPDAWGIPTPGEESIAERELAIPPVDSPSGDDGTRYGSLDLIVMPGMAFDTEMGRLGHGKGFYDYFLARCQGHARIADIKMPYLVGLALTEQLLEDPIPMDESDRRLDALITGDGELLRSSS